MPIAEDRQDLSRTRTNPLERSQSRQLFGWWPGCTRALKFAQTSVPKSNAFRVAESQSVAEPGLDLPAISLTRWDHGQLPRYRMVQAAKSRALTTDECPTKPYANPMQTLSRYGLQSA